MKGVPIGEALDIDIPPPRPKRKPSNPYPRKTNASLSKNGKSLFSLPSSHGKQALDLEKQPLPEVIYIYFLYFNGHSNYLFSSSPFQ